MIIANSTNKLLSNTLFHNNKIIKLKHNNQKNISEQLLTIRTLIILPEEPHPEEQAQLFKIFAACNLEPKDYFLAFPPLSWKELRQYQNIREILLFGTPETELDLPIQLPYNKNISFDDRTWVKTLSVQELMNNKEMKNALWQNALKPHFGDK